MELLVVIGILGILMAVAVPQIGKARESARAAQCMSNMRTLAQACCNAAMENNRYPQAGSTEYSASKKINGEYKTVYAEHHGWISWQSKGKFDGTPTEKVTGLKSIGWGEGSEEDRHFALTNGAIWTAVSGNRSCYVCPTVKQSHPDIAWTYAMNAYFRYDTSEGADVTATADSGIGANSLSQADRRLMFAELDIPTKDDASGTSGGTGYASDGIFEYDDGVSSHREKFGFHHKSGTKKCTHVAFADAHVERLVEPSSGDTEELAEWLCKGLDVTMEDGAYRKADSDAE